MIYLMFVCDLQMQHVFCVVCCVCYRLLRTRYNYNIAYVFWLLRENIYMCVVVLFDNVAQKKTILYMFNMKFYDMI